MIDVDTYRMLPKPDRERPADTGSGPCVRPRLGAALRVVRAQAAPMTPHYAPPCPHRCCSEPDDAPPHEHDVTVPECKACASLAEVHPLSLKALGIASRKHPGLTRDERNEEQ